MQTQTERAISILSDLVAFKSLSTLPNSDIIGYIENYLNQHGLQCHKSFDETGQLANIHACIGPKEDGGVLLNGHTDVVPVEGQTWTNDPFTLTKRDNKLYGRGSCDMKGFLACMLAAVPDFQKMDLKKPIHISTCFDEEIGGLGAPILAKDILKVGPRPRVCIVGEPTLMGIIKGHKGGLEFCTEITGVEVHSSNPSKGVSAISYAARFIHFLDDLAKEIATKPYKNSPYTPPYATFNVGLIKGGIAGNITAGSCQFSWEIRPIPGEDASIHINRIEDFVQNTLLPEMRENFATPNIQNISHISIPVLDDSQTVEAVEFLHEITGLNSSGVVSFGTDAGYFCNEGISTVVFGPGNIDQAHNPDEFIEISQLDDCMKFLNKLGDHMSKD